MSSPLHERLKFDTDAGQVLDQDRRYVLMRADVLMGLFAALPEPDRQRAMEALGQSVWRHGADSVKAYASQPGCTPDMLLHTMQSSAASLGWGRWAFEEAPGGLRLQVSNSPFAAMASFHDRPACSAIVGMLQALGEALWRAPVQVCETRCAAMSEPAACTCQFDMWPQTALTSVPPGHGPHFDLQL
jgi:uncharacterized protein